MAHCVIVGVVDTGPLRDLRPDGDPFAAPACAVHASYAPCQHDGEPAVAVAIHVPPGFSREVGLHMWQVKTHKQRPLVLHNDDPARTATDHVIDIHNSPCWCGPEVLPAEEAAND